MNIKTLLKRDLKTRPYNMDMSERDLEKLSKSELIKMLLKQRNQRRFVTMRTCSKVAQEPAKRIKPPPPPILQVEEKEHITDVPSSKIKELKRALRNHAKSYEIELQDNLSPLNHFMKTRPLTESHLETS